MKTVTQHSKNTRQAGFGHVVTIAVIVLIVSSIGYIGFKLYAHPAKSDDSAMTAVPMSSKADIVPTAPDVNSASDLDKASAALDGVDPATDSKPDESALNNQLSAIE